MNTARKGQSSNEEKAVISTCSCHCGGKCLVKVHVKDGILTRIEAGDSEEPALRPCVLGRSYRQRLYAPDRLRYPMRRVGVRGEGKFERITWDEALGTIAGELKRIKENYGPGAILLLTSGGDLGWLHQESAIERLLAMMGGCTRTWGRVSNEGGRFAAQATYGTMYTRSTDDDLLNSRLIILWGWNPTSTVTGHTAWYLAQAKEKGIRIVSVDPRYTDTTAIFADQWIPIFPGTDAAMLISMAYVIIERSLHDQAFLEAYTTGFDQFKAYVLGKEDGIAKTPAWAEAITGVPVAVIENLAVDYAMIKPAALMAGIGPGRTAYGEQYHRAAITLSAMTGNIGVHGGSSAGPVWVVYSGGYQFVNPPHFGIQPMAPDNPIDQNSPLRKYTLPSYGPSASSARIHWVKVADAILKGSAGGYPADYKLLYIVNTNYPNQYGDINKAVKALRKLEFIVVHEQFMTPAAKFADIVLPSSSLYERNDVTSGHVTPPFYGYMRKVIEPSYESKSHFEIAAGLANRLGLSSFDDRTEEERLKEAVKSAPVPDYDSFKQYGFYRVELSEPHAAFKVQRANPAKYPFPTPSGKIEIYSQLLAAMNCPELPPVPKYIEPWESANDPLSEKYPLRLITTHFKLRTHTQFANIPWLGELQPQAMLINSLDARDRNINDGDKVRVFNDRGETIIEARVTERIIPGVVDIPQGAWFAPDERGIDRGGSANMLTKDEHSLGGALASNTCLVQVEKA